MVFLYGLVAGSFLNVCIYRIPEGLSIIRPASFCPSCGRKVRFYDNIPLLSYLFLKGRCRSCGSSISMRYPFVELFNAVLYLTAWSVFNSASIITLITYFVFISALVVIIFIDIDFQIIPDVITIPGIFIGLISGSAFLPDPFFRNGLLGLKASFVGLFAGAAGFYLIAVLGKMIFRKDAMGFGDIKLMGVVGSFLGWKGVVFTTFLGSLLGSVVGIALIAGKGREWGSQIPFGPYLAVGALTSLFWGEEILSWYLR
ncbi:MAG: prepilin peptidase [Nitrospirae bacterium]|nr:prepilin peptidase [Nitrospirota bacterium]